MEYKIKRELNKVILENITMFPPNIFGVTENSLVAALIPAHNEIYSVAPEDLKTNLVLASSKKLKPGDLGYSFSIVDSLGDALVDQYKLDESDIKRLIDKLTSFIKIPVFDRTQRKILGKIIRDEIDKLEGLSDNPKVSILIYNTIIGIICEERRIAKEYFNASSTYVERLDNALYLAYLYKKMVLSMELNGDSVDNTDGYIYKTLTKLPTLGDYIENTDEFLFMIFPLGRLLDPTQGASRVQVPNYDIQLVNLDAFYKILEIEKDYLLDSVESNVPDILFDFTGANAIIKANAGNDKTSQLLKVYSNTLDGLVNPRIVENSVRIMNNGIVLDDLSCDRKDLFVIINTVMGPYCRKVLDNNGTISYRTNTIRGQKGSKITLMELKKREGINEDTFVYIVSASTRKTKNRVSSMVLSLLQIHHNGKTPKLASLASTDDSLSIKYNVKNIHCAISIDEPKLQPTFESINGSFYLDESKGRFRYSKKIKYDNVHKEFNDALFYIKASRRSKNINMMKSMSVKLMDILLYTESYIYDDKTKREDEETKKFIALRANVISELHKTVQDISNIDGEFNFHDYYSKESKEVRSVSVNSFVRAAFSLLGDLVNQTVGLSRKPFM